MKRSINILPFILAAAIVIFADLTLAQSWQSLNGPKRGSANVQDLAIGAPSDPATIYYAQGQTIYRSLDGGTTWGNTLSIGANPLALTCKPGTPSRVVVAYSTGAKYSDDNGSTWNPCGNVGLISPNRLACSSADQNFMLLGLARSSCTRASLKISTDGGQSWTDVYDEFRDAYNTDITALATHPANQNIAFAGGTTNNLDCSMGLSIGNSTNGVFFTTDEGSSWYRSGSSWLKNITALITYMYNNTLYTFAATDNASDKLRLSTNATNTGASWTTVTNYPGGFIKDLRIDQSSPPIIYAATDNGVYTSPNNGYNWYVCPGNGFVDPNNIKRIGIDPVNSSIVFAGASTDLYRSTDGGWTWRDDAQSSTTLSSSAVAVNGSVYLALPTNYSVVERNAGAGWYPVGVGCCVQDFRGIMVGFKNSDGSVAFAAGYRQAGASLWRSTNGGDYSWAEVRSGTIGKFNGVSFDPVNTDWMYVFGLRANNDNVSTSANGGNSWQRFSIPNNDATSVSTVADFAIDSSNHGTISHSLKVFACINGTITSDNGIWIGSVDAGTWTQVTDVLVYQKPVAALGFNTKTPQVVYAAGGDNGWKMWKSTNGGTNWSTLTSMTERVSRILMHPSYPNYSSFAWIIAASNTKIYKTADGGNSWTNVTGAIPTPIYDLRCDLTTNVNIYAATGSGIYVIDPAPEAPTGFGVMDYGPDKGGHYYPNLHWNANFETDMKYSPAYYHIERKIEGQGYYSPLVNLLDTSFIDYGASQTLRNYYIIKAVDAGGNASDFSPYITWPMQKIGYPASKEAPRKFQLLQNMPNPFNPTTSIQYEIPDNLHVTLRIYDVLGCEVATLVDEMQDAGVKSVQFEANHLASGIYFYQLQAGKFTDVKKMLLAR